MLLRRQTLDPRGRNESSPRWPQWYLSQKVLVAADSMVKSLDQQRLHVLKNQPSACVERGAGFLWLWGRLALGRIHLSYGAGVGALGGLPDLLGGSRTRVPETDMLSVLLRAT